MNVENIEIPILDDNISLKASIYFSSTTQKRAPFIINISGIANNHNSSFVSYFSKKFALAGYYVLSYDHRGHENIKNLTKRLIIDNIIKIFMDLHHVISWIMINQKDRLLNEQIILFGRSLGGAIILTRGFIDERAKILIPLCTRYDYHSYSGIRFSEEIIKEISPKYFLKANPINNSRILTAHCIDDDVIPYENVILLKKHLGIGDENVITFNTGSHSFKNHKEELFKRCNKFIKKI